MTATDQLRQLVPGSIWQGCGMTVRVLDVVGSDVRVERLTGRGGLLKRPSRPALLIGKAFVDGRMKPLNPSRGDPWARAIVARFDGGPALTRAVEEHTKP